MTTTDAGVLATEQPDSVRAYLKAGGDPTALDGWIYMAEAVCGRRDNREGARLFYEHLLVEMIAGAPVDRPLPLKGFPEYQRAVGLRCRRILELLDSEPLAARFELALPVEVMAAHRRGSITSLRPSPDTGRRRGPSRSNKPRRVRRRRQSAPAARDSISTG